MKPVIQFVVIIRVFEGETTRLERRDGATYWIVRASEKTT